MPALPATSLHVDVGGFEGPLDLLLALARRQKVDLREVSLLALARQCLDFVAEADRARLDLSADCLVMAAWLAYLKSCLLLPSEPGGDPEAGDPDPDPAYRLARLEALRQAAVLLMAGPRLGLDTFPSGGAEAMGEVRTQRLEASLHDLLAAYARVRTRDDFRPFAQGRPHVMTMEEALALLRPALRGAPWAELRTYLPVPPSDPAPELAAERTPGPISGPTPGPTPGPARRSTLAATFAGVLELVREGRAEVRQDAAFAPLMVRGREPGGG